MSSQPCATAKAKAARGRYISLLNIASADEVSDTTKAETSTNARKQKYFSSIDQVSKFFKNIFRWFGIKIIVKFFRCSFIGFCAML